MTVTATPTLTVAGQPVAAGAGPSLVAVDKLRIPWGRRGLLERTSPSQAQLTVLDTGAGAPFARRTDLTGQPVVLGWSGSDGSSGTLFRGRIGPVDVRPRTGGGFLASMTCTSKEIDAANYLVPEGASWPAETHAQRRDRIVALFPAGLFPGGAALPTWAQAGLTSDELADPSVQLYDYQAKAAGAAYSYGVAGKDALALLRELYDSVSALPMVYDPTADGFTFAQRRRYLFNPATGQAPSGRLVAAADRAGRYVAAPVAGSPALALPADTLAYTGPLSQPLEGRLTRVEVGWLNGTAGATVVASSGADETALGRRTLSIESLHTDAGRATTLATLWSRLAFSEAAVPRLDALTYSTARHPFPDAARASGLLRCTEAGAQCFLGGAWSARLGVRPLYGVLGGAVGYGGGDWSIDLNPAPVSIEWDTPPLRIGHASSPAAAATLAQIDRSVTFGDLAFVHVGPGYTETSQVWS